MNQKTNSLIYGLGILAILTVGAIIMPSVASADRAGRVTPYGSTEFNDVTSNDNQYNTYQGPPETATTTPTTSSTGQVKGATTTAKTTPKATEPEKVEEESSVTANAIFGTNGFTPSGLIQWILLAILILLIVILVRKFTGAEDKYHSEPLKHA